MGTLMRALRIVFLVTLLALPIAVLAAPKPEKAPDKTSNKASDKSTGKAVDKAPDKPTPDNARVFALGEFGSTKAGDAQATYVKALAEVKKKGGVLLVPGDTWKLLKDVPLQGLDRSPPAPA